MIQLLLPMSTPSGDEFSSQNISRERYESDGVWGLLASINLYECDRHKITDPETMRRFVFDLCKEIDMKPHGEPHIEKFGDDSLEGHSVLQFIETSSITIHFDDKMGSRAFIDIFSCKYFDQHQAFEFAKNYFNAQSGKVWSLIRS